MNQTSIAYDTRSLGQLTKDTVRTTGFGDTMDKLEREVSIADEVCERLIGRLKPFISYPDQKEQAPTPERKYPDGIARIQNCASALRQTNLKLNTILEGLEL